MPYATIRDVRRVDVVGSEMERPLFAPQRTFGSWTQTLPSQARTDVALDALDESAPEWLDVAVELQLTLLMEVDPGEIDTLRTTPIEDFTSLADFRSRFRYFDLDAFMEENGIATVAELRRAYHHLLAEIKLKPTPPFDANDPDNVKGLPLRVAVLVRDTVDVAGALRDAKRVRKLLERTVAWTPTSEAGEATAPFAPIVVFPRITGTQTQAEASQSAIAALYAHERIVTVFK